MSNARRFRGCQGNVLWIYAAVMIPLCFILVLTTPTFSVSNFMKTGFSLSNYPSTTMLSDGEAVHTETEDFAKSEPTKEESEFLRALESETSEGQKEIQQSSEGSDISGTESSLDQDENAMSNDLSQKLEDQGHNSEPFDDINQENDTDETVNRSVKESKSQNTMILEAKQKLCSKDEFFMPENFTKSCFVPPPDGYKLPFNRTSRLWRTPRKNLGWLNTSEHDYYNQVHNQRWATIDDNDVFLRENGGTSVRAFGDNIKYFHLLKNHTRWDSRCRGRTKPSILDTGAGVASVAAVARDERVGNNSVSVLSYVPVDNYLRLGNIISERGLPVYIHYFSADKKIPIPDASLDVVHCRWCWHHMAGYDVWLKEMDRLLVPGGAFVFTFVPLKDENLLPHKPWFEALDKMPWDCERYDRIIQVCIKNTEGLSMPNCALKDITPNEQNITKHMNNAFGVMHKITKHNDDIDRVLNINCPFASTCDSIDRIINKQNVMNTFSTKESTSKELARLLHSGKLGVLHDWTKPGPFYPRMFDVVNLLCSEEEIVTSGLLNEIHRILRPDGFAISSKSTCKNFEAIHKLVDELYFSIIHEQDDVLVLQRK